MEKPGGKIASSQREKLLLYWVETITVLKSFKSNDYRG